MSLTYDFVYTQVQPQLSCCLHTQYQWSYGIVRKDFPQPQENDSY